MKDHAYNRFGFECQPRLEIAQLYPNSSAKLSVFVTVNQARKNGSTSFSYKIALQSTAGMVIGSIDLPLEFILVKSNKAQIADKNNFLSSWKQLQDEFKFSYSIQARPLDSLKLKLEQCGIFMVAEREISGQAWITF